MLSKILKKLFLLVIALVVIIQFFQPDKNQSNVPSKNDITTQYQIPDDVMMVFKNSCYDCHSNNTIYPWYSNIQPVAWWLADHVNEGKDELNFSEFMSYDLERQDKKLREIIEEIEEDKMPLKSYTLVHRSAKLSTEQKEKIISWAKENRLRLSNLEVEK